MNHGKNNPAVLFAGRYNPGETLSGPEKTAKRIFTVRSGVNNDRNRTVLIEYFFDGREYGTFKKLFGNETFYISSIATVKRLGLFRLPGELKRNNPGILHIITFERFAVILLLYAKLKKVKVIYNSHGAVNFENTTLKKTGIFHKFKDKTAEMLLLKLSDKIVFPSEAVIDISKRYFKFGDNKAVILPGGIDSKFYKKGFIPGSGKPLKAVFIYKNIYSSSGLKFLNSFLDELTVKLELHIISPVNIAPAGNEFVTIFNYKPMNASELADFYCDKDVFLSLNSYDTFSISAAEAMASGLVPVITKQTGLERYIENTVNGFVVDYGDTKGLIECINSINGFTENRLKEIKLNASGIYETLKWKDVYELYNNLYKELNS